LESPFIQEYAVATYRAVSSSSSCSSSERILLLADEIKSRIGVFSSLGDELAAQGHDVTWFLSQ
jgi:hypothetical protein